MERRDACTKDSACVRDGRRLESFKRAHCAQLNESGEGGCQHNERTRKQRKAKMNSHTMALLFHSVQNMAPMKCVGFSALSWRSAIICDVIMHFHAASPIIKIHHMDFFSYVDAIQVFSASNLSTLRSPQNDVAVSS